MDAVVKCVLLVPVRYNDGRTIPEEVFELIFAGIYELAGGLTFAHTTKGAYRMADGTKKIDECQCVWIAVPKRDIPAPRTLVAKIAATLGQESMFLEHASGKVEFVKPFDEGIDNESES